jgi:hypothetical protein
MRILGSQAGGAVLVLSLDDVRPIQGVTPQQIVDMLAIRYKFAARPRAASAST